MRIFKDIHGHRLDPIQHTLDILKEHPNVQIHVGSDSQNVGKIDKICYGDRLPFWQQGGALHSQ
jgi:hypothetical protein